MGATTIAKNREVDRNWTFVFGPMQPTDRLGASVRPGTILVRRDNDQRALVLSDLVTHEYGVVLVARLIVGSRAKHCLGKRIGITPEDLLDPRCPYVVERQRSANPQNPT